MSENAGEHVQLAADPGLDRYVIHLARVLISTMMPSCELRAFVEDNDFTRIHSFIGDDGLMSPEFAVRLCEFEIGY